jgi:hypothetical protein
MRTPSLYPLMASLKSGPNPSALKLVTKHPCSPSSTAFLQWKLQEDPGESLCCPGVGPLRVKQEPSRVLCHVCNKFKANTLSHMTWAMKDLLAHCKGKFQATQMATERQGWLAEMMEEGRQHCAGKSLTLPSLSFPFFLLCDCTGP